MQPAWVLGRQSYRDSSYLVHFLTASDGRLSAVVKGAHRKQRGGMMAALMQLLSNTINLVGDSNQLEFAVVGAVILIGASFDEVFRRLLQRRRARRR